MGQTTTRVMEDDIRAALASAETPRERLQAFCALETSGRRGGPALRERQAAVERRLNLLAFGCGRGLLDAPGTPGALPSCWLPGLPPLGVRVAAWLDRAAYRSAASAARRASRERRLAAESAAAESARRRELARRYIHEVDARGGEIEIGSEGLSVASESGGLILLRAEGWRQYSRRFGARRAQLAYLCGVDDSGPWAARVAGSCTTVAQALDWLEPAAVRRARERGRRVVRQGDVYAVECRRCDDGAGADTLARTRHEWCGWCRVLLHPEHSPVQVAFPVRFAAQRTYRMGRSGGWGRAD